MQTFLPYPSFARSAAVLDRRRLGKQRVEALQILRALHLDDYGWRSHPAVLMWRGHTAALVAYGLAVVDEWQARGRADTTRTLIAEFARPDRPSPEADLSARQRPPWLGWDALHASHRSALLRKDPDHYRPRFADSPADLGYVWPAPPAGPVEPAPVCGWAVRAADAASVELFASAGLVGVPARLAAADASPRLRRQLRLFTEQPRPGQPVVLPLDGRLLVGELTGEPASGPGLAAARGSCNW